MFMYSLVYTYGPKKESHWKIAQKLWEETPVFEKKHTRPSTEAKKGKYEIGGIKIEYLLVSFVAEEIFNI